MIITLQLEESARHYFNERRKAYFPAHINYLEAHLTLFHALPSGEQLIQSTLEQLSKRAHISLHIEYLKNIGNGVAYKVTSPELQTLHASMQKAFEPFLVGKDKQTLWPHITVQNKVTAFKAQLLFEVLSKDFKPFTIIGTGISTYLYEGGPWQHMKDFAFEG